MELILTITKAKDVKAGDISKVLTALEKASFKAEALPTYFNPKVLRITK